MLERRWWTRTPASWVAALKRGGLVSPASSLPVDWAESLNFLGPRVRTGVWGWALLGLGLLACLHVADQASGLQSELDEARVSLQRLQHGERTQAVREAAAVKAAMGGGEGSAADAAPALQSDGWVRAAQLAQWLSYDWLRTLDRVDVASLDQHAVLMQLHLDLSTLGLAPGSQPELHLQAAVLDDDAALQWVQSLGPQATLITRDGLSSSFSSTPGTYAWRAEAVTSGAQP